MSYSRKLWASALALGLTIAAHGETPLLNETWNSVSGTPVAITSATTSFTADNVFNACAIGASSGSMQIDDDGTGNLTWDHIAGGGGSGLAGDAIMSKSSGVTGVDIGTIAAANTLLFQFDIQQNSFGDALTVDPGNRNVSAEVWGRIGGTGTSDGFAVRMKPTVSIASGGAVTFQVGKISALTPPFSLGSAPFVFTATATAAMPTSAKKLRFLMMLKPTVIGATTGNTNLTYRVLNVTDGTDFMAPATGVMAFGPRATITTDTVAVRMRTNSLVREDNIKIIANPNPVITPTGANPVTVPASSPYTDLGVTGIDATDRVLTTSSSPTAITNDSASSVNTNALGTYTVTYTATNSIGNTGTATRTVIVTDQTGPVITVTGSNPATVALGGTYSDLGATAIDNIDGNVTGSIVPTSTVNTAAIGSYTVTYNVSDSHGNAATPAIRTVNVTDQTAPVITLLGTDPVTVAQGATYSDAGATAFDNVDGNITANIVAVNPVDTNTLGDYVVTYNVHDAANNNAIQVTRTVHVTDQTAPNAITITPATTGPTNATSVSFSVSFDESVQNFINASDLVINQTGVVHTGATITGGPQNYTVTVTGVSGNGTLSLAVSTGSDVKDLAGNALASSVTSGSVTIDNTAPVPALSATAAATVGGAFTVDIDTGESTVDFDASDLTVTNGTVVALSFTGSGSVYSFSLNPTGTPVTAKINASKYTDAAGNANSASNTLSRNFDSTLPSVVSIVPAPVLSGPTNADSLNFTVTFDEAVQNVNAANDFIVTTTGSVSTGTVTVSTVSTTVYTVTIPSIVGDGTLTLEASTTSDIKDVTNNPLGSSITSAPVTIDNTGTGITLSSSALDPTNSSILVNVVLTEAVTTFGVGNISATNGVVGSFSGSGSAYSFILTGSTDGAVSAKVNAGVFTDVAGNANLASNTVSRTWDTSGPTFVGLDVSPSSAFIGQEVQITFSSSEPIAGEPDVTVNGNAATHTAKGAYTYTYTVQETDPLGPATIQIGGLDNAGNAGALTSPTALTIITEPVPVPVAALPVGLAVALAGTVVLRRKRSAK